jgi:hypothetical protein
MENNRQHSQEGTGGAENKGQERSDQMNQMARVSESQKQQIAEEIDTPIESIASLEDLGALSGRDDQSGGSNDRMEQEDTGAPTER